jgi:hypothetical protein
VHFELPTVMALFGRVLNDLTFISQLTVYYYTYIFICLCIAIVSIYYIDISYLNSIVIQMHSNPLR